MPQEFPLRELHYAVEKVCPIYGVKVQDWDDRTTWSIDYKEEATEQQKAAAMTALLSYGTGDETPENVGSPEVIE